MNEDINTLNNSPVNAQDPSLQAKEKDEEIVADSGLKTNDDKKVKKYYSLKTAEKDVEVINEKIAFLYDEISELKNDIKDIRELLTFTEDGKVRTEEDGNVPTVDLTNNTASLDDNSVPGHLQTDNEDSSSSQNNDIIKMVKDILGKSFSVSIKAMEPGVTFKLIIIPPDELKEYPEDQRTKVIPYLEGVAGAKEYALKVKEFCTNWAQKNGRFYSWPM